MEKRWSFKLNIVGKYIYIKHRKVCINIKSKYRMQKVGLKAKKIKRINYIFVDIEFEDGTIRENMCESNFYANNIVHPKFKKVKEICTYKDMKFFMCECRICKGKHFLPLNEMKDFKCDRGYIHE